MSYISEHTISKIFDYIFKTLKIRNYFSEILQNTNNFSNMLSCNDDFSEMFKIPNYIDGFSIQPILEFYTQTELSERYHHMKMIKSMGIKINNMKQGTWIEGILFNKNQGSYLYKTLNFKNDIFHGIEKFITLNGYIMIERKYVEGKEVYDKRYREDYIVEYLNDNRIFPYTIKQYNATNPNPNTRKFSFSISISI
jgi:hypothetical protein